MIALQNHKHRLVTYFNSLAVRLDDRVSYEHRLAILIVFTIGLALRVYAWYVGEGYLYFTINDEILAYRYALGFLAGETHTYYLAQPAFAAGQAPGPLWTVFCVMLLKLGQGSMHYALFWMALFNSIAIYLVYRLARHFVAPGLALFAMLYFALTPWAIYYSTGLYNPLPLVVIGGFLFLTLWNVLNQNDSPQIFWVCLICASIPQFHMIGVFYLPVIAFLLIISSRSVNKKWLVLGILAGLALYVPYLVGEWQHDFANTKSMLTGSDDHSYGVVKILTAPITMISSIPAGWAGREFSATIAYADAWFGSIYVLLVFCLISLAFSLTVFIYFFKMTFNSFKGTWHKPAVALSQNPKPVFIFSLLVLPLLLFVFTRHSYATRYTLLILPLLSLLPILFYKNILNHIFKRVSTITVGILLCFNVYLTLSFYFYQGNMINDDTNFSPSFKSMELLAHNLYEKVGPHKRIILTLSDRIQHLPQGERKIAVALTEYFQILDKYTPQSDPLADNAVIKMDLGGDISPPGHGEILHRANGMIFILQNQ